MELVLTIRYHKCVSFFGGKVSNYIKRKNNCTRAQGHTPVKIHHKPSQIGKENNRAPSPNRQSNKQCNLAIQAEIHPLKYSMIFGATYFPEIAPDHGGS